MSGMVKPWFSHQLQTHDFSHWHIRRMNRHPVSLRGGQTCLLKVFNTILWQISNCCLCTTYFFAWALCLCYFPNYAWLTSGCAEKQLGGSATPVSTLIGPRGCFNQGMVVQQQPICAHPPSIGSLTWQSNLCVSIWVQELEQQDHLI